MAIQYLDNVAPIPDDGKRIITPGEADYWEPPTLAEWCESVKDVPRWLLVNWLPADANVIISGKAKRAYKSWLLFLMSMAVASGKKLSLFEPANPEGESVLILEAEGGRAETKDRWECLANSYGYASVADIPNLAFSHRENILLDDPTWVKRIQGYIKRHKTRLIGVDPLVMFSRGNENDVEHVSEIMRTFTLFREYNAGVIFLHHLTKTSPEWVKDIDEELRGSSALAGFYDTHLALRQRRDGQGFNELTRRSKEYEEAKFEVTWHINKAAKQAYVDIVESSAEASMQRLVEEMSSKLMPGAVYTKGRIANMLGLGDAHNASELVEHALAASVLERVGRNFRPFTGSGDEN